jgi:hypothetical protein
VQAISSIGAGAAISGVAERVFSTARELGDIGLRAFQKVWPTLSNPRRGVPLAVLGIKLIEHFAPDPNIVDPLFQFGEWMERYDPKGILGEEPPIFNINWDVINAAIPDEQCGWGDVFCATRNALRALARGIIGGFAGIGSFIYWALWHLAYYAIKAFLSLGAFIIKYLVVPVAKAIITAVNTVFTLIKRALCAYIQHVAPYITIYRAIEDLASGRKFKTAIDIGAGHNPPDGGGVAGLRLPIPTPRIRAAGRCTYTDTGIYAASWRHLRLQLLPRLRQGRGDTE